MLRKIRDDFMESHDAAHEEPLAYWGECDICRDFIEGEIEDGLRCKHGNYIPYMPDKRGYLYTDVECDECAIDYGPSIYAFMGQWAKSIEGELLK